MSKVRFQEAIFKKNYGRKEFFGGFGNFIFSIHTSSVTPRVDVKTARGGHFSMMQLKVLFM